MSLLTVVQRANRLVGLRRPSVAAAAPDATSTAQMAEMAAIEAESLANRHDWDRTLFSHQFTTTANQAQPGALPDDFARFSIAGGIYGPWGRIEGPYQRDEWSRITSYPQVAGAINGGFRVYQRGVQIYPAPPVGQAYRFDYITTNLYEASDGTPKAAWSADTDTCLIPESLIALGVVWRWLQAKGLDYGEAMRNAEMEFAKLAGFDGGARRTIAVGGARLKADDYAFPGILGPRP